MDTLRAPDDAGLSFSNFDPSPDQYLSFSDTGQTNLDKKPTFYPRDPGLSDGIPYRGHPSGTSMVPFAGGSLYPPHESFTATNIDDMNVHDVFKTSTISPLQTYLDGDTVTCDSSESNGSFSVGKSACSTTSTTPAQWSYTMDRDGPVEEWRHESIRSHVNFAPRAGQRRRTSDKTEPGSARAVYLEKNQQAASKCRTKQKRQQEDLVETAREVERKNKVLKWEVEFSKSELRNLMKLVGKHSECPDGRLRRYVQWEADWLSARDDRSLIAELLSSNAAPMGTAPRQRIYEATSE
ncbi:hypothetical protein PMIN03_012395 [Paraphaeosphaeria minitans]